MIPFVQEVSFLDQGKRILIDYLLKVIESVNWMRLPCFSSSIP